MVRYRGLLPEQVGRPYRRRCEIGGKSPAAEDKGQFGGRPSSELVKDAMSKENMRLSSFETVSRFVGDLEKNTAAVPIFYQKTTNLRPPAIELKLITVNDYYCRPIFTFTLTTVHRS